MFKGMVPPGLFQATCVSGAPPGPNRVLQGQQKQNEAQEKKELLYHKLLHPSPLKSIYIYLSGTFRTCQLCGFWHFSAISTTFASMCKHVVTWGGGGVRVYFLKSVRKRRFRNVWVGGG